MTQRKFRDTPEYLGGKGMTCYSELFTPTHIGKVQLKNRTSMAPMGPVGYADAFGGFTRDFRIIMCSVHGTV